MLSCMRATPDTKGVRVAGYYVHSYLVGMETSNEGTALRARG